LLWLALLLGYLAGLGVAFLFLPRGALEPFYGPLAWAAAAISALGVITLLHAYRRRGKTGEPEPDRGAAADRAAAGGPLALRQDMPEPLGADLLRRAVYHGRVGAWMRPVAGLSPRRVALYRAEPRLCDHDGAFLAPDVWRPPAARLGLLGLIDRILVVRCAQIIRRIREQGGEVGLLCDLAAGRLGDPGLIDMLDELVTVHPDLGSRLVLEVGRAKLDRPADKAVARLRRIGIRLCLGRVGVRGLDAVELASRGFGFVRIAPPGSAGGPDTELVQQVLGAAGIELMVDRVGSEPVPDELLERRLLSEQPFTSNRSSAA
jgi:cyclic-di-GMP phosphodiesterase, flagellum assembly factor TipF